LHQVLPGILILCGEIFSRFQAQDLEILDGRQREYQCQLVPELVPKGYHHRQWLARFSLVSQMKIIICNVLYDVQLLCPVENPERVLRMKPQPVRKLTFPSEVSSDDSESEGTPRPECLCLSRGDNNITLSFNSIGVGNWEYQKSIELVLKIMMACHVLSYLIAQRK
jgi:hypothetical protein